MNNQNCTGCGKIRREVEENRRAEPQEYKEDCAMCFAQKKGVFVPPHIHKPQEQSEESIDEFIDKLFSRAEIPDWAHDAKEPIKSFIRQQIDRARNESYTKGYEDSKSGRQNKYVGSS